MRLTYPIQEAADPKDHFPLEHQTAEGETEIETKQIQLGHPFAALLSAFVLHMRMWTLGERIPENQEKKIKKYKMAV